MADATSSLTVSSLNLQGLVGAEKASKAIRDITGRLVERYREREHAYFVAVVPNGETPSGDLAVSLLYESEVPADRILGVFTRADRAIGDEPSKVAHAHLHVDRMGVFTYPPTPI